MITVVITTYFRNELLRRAIDSVRNQTYDDVEVVVVDGSEKEHAREVVDGYEDIEYVCPTPDPGFHKSREIGVRQGSGDFIQFLDDDDWLKSTKLEKSLEKFQDGIGMVYCGVEHHNSAITNLPDPQAQGDVLTRALAFDMTPALPSTWTIRRSTLEEILPFSHPDGADDEGTHIELSQVTNYDFVNEPLVVLGTENEQSFNMTWDYVEGLEYLVEEYQYLYSQAPDWVLSSAREKIYLNRGNMHLQERYWTPVATWNFIRAAIYSPNNKVKRGLQAGLSLFGKPGVEMGELTLKKFRRWV